MTAEPYPFTDGGLRAALDALGSTTDEIAATLLRLGHRGVQMVACRCPIASYLTAVMDASEVEASPASVRVHHLDFPFPVRGMVPTPVAAFMSRFDVGDYPDLIEKEPSDGS